MFTICYWYVTYEYQEKEWPQDRALRNATFDRPGVAHTIFNFDRKIPRIKKIFDKPDQVIRNAEFVQFKYDTIMPDFVKGFGNIEKYSTSLPIFTKSFTPFLSEKSKLSEAPLPSLKPACCFWKALEFSRNL